MTELQNLDCNCNNCKYMTRDTDRFKRSLEQHYKWALDYFNGIKERIIKSANHWKEKGNTNKYKVLMGEANKMKFQFNKKEIAINYGDCEQFEKAVSFIPNTLQLHTQECFKNRKQKQLKIKT